VEVVLTCKTLHGAVNVGAHREVSRTTVALLSLEIYPEVSLSSLVNGVLLIPRVIAIIIPF
jgi:hypothetical protein